VGYGSKNGGNSAKYGVALSGRIPISNQSWKIEMDTWQQINVLLPKLKYFGPWC